jgi:long-chain acyl-CoA synthetase
MIKENFVEFLGSSIKANWDIEALGDYQGDSYTYKEVAERIVRIQIGFELAGIKKGDKIALIGKNSANWSVVFLATVTYGAVIVPILPDFITDDVHHIVNHSDALILFAGDSNYEALNIEKMPHIRAVFSLSDFKPVITKDKSELDDIDEKVVYKFEKQYPKGFTMDDFQLG